MLVVILMDILALKLMGVFIYLLVLVIKVLQAGRDHAGGRQPAVRFTKGQHAFTVSTHVETVCLLGRRKPDDTIKVSVNMDDYYQIRDAEEAEKNPS